MTLESILGLPITLTADQKALSEMSETHFRILLLRLLAPLVSGLPQRANSQGVPTNLSGTATGLSVAGAIPANPDRVYLSFQNPSGNTGTFWLHLGNGTAAAGSPCVEVKPGQGFVMTAADFVVTGAISIIGTNTEKWTAWGA